MKKEDDCIIYAYTKIVEDKDSKNFYGETMLFKQWMIGGTIVAIKRIR